MPTFDNRFVRELPGDADASARSRQVHGALWSPAVLAPVAAPRLLAHSATLAVALGLDPAALAAPPWIDALAGNALLPGMLAWSTSYGGHQFGVWAGQLGDGRATSIGELIAPDGARWELQLKGAGPTAYSRGSDGRAVLRSSLREFVCSEAMHALGVPTTRALSLVATGETVVRDMFYRGDPRPEPGAIVCRVAPSFLRFGHFELPASRGDSALLARLLDFAIDRDFPELAAEVADPDARRVEWFARVCELTATMVAHWMRVGFVHGVMNTDNLSILGLTIDYGPYGWIDAYDPDWTPNTTDAERRRYRFGQQPAVAGWNLTRLAGALLPLVGDPEPLNAGLQRYLDRFDRDDRRMSADKLGLAESREDDVARMARLRELLAEGELDMTLFFRALGEWKGDADDLAAFAPAIYDAVRWQRVVPDLGDWLSAYAARLDDDPQTPDQRGARMDAANPLYVPRNFLAQQAIDRAETGDLTELHALMDVLSRPYVQQPGRERFAARRPDWARDRPGCSMLSCSS